MLSALLLAAMIGAVSCQSVPRPKVLPRKTVGDSSQTCIFCKFYVSMIEDYLKDGKTIEEITKTVEGLCEYTSETIKPICVSLVDTFLPTIIQLIEQQMEQAQICVLIKLCKD